MQVLVVPVRYEKSLSRPATIMLFSVLVVLIGHEKYINRKIRAEAGMVLIVPIRYEKEDHKLDVYYMFWLYL